MMRRDAMPNEPPRAGRSPGLVLRLAAAWALVGIPLVWGVWQVINRSMALFR